MLTTVGGSSPVVVGCSGVTTLNSELGHRSTEVRIIAGHVIIVFAVDLAQLSETHANNADALAEYSGHVRDHLAVRWRIRTNWLRRRSYTPSSKTLLSSEYVKGRHVNTN